ncbi:hypothetical protein GCM10022381_33560 [Leifsonia kafniensis]|uniref:Lipase n=1 Tax=Leifsonia kafniensis TaxID=475957 RepID=A0ABP7KVI6_9MICO
MHARGLRDRVRFLPGMIGRAPWWVAVVVGLAAVALGAILIVRPLSSLGTLGLFLGLSFIASGLSDMLGVDLRAADPSRAPRTNIRAVTALAVGWIAAGVILIVWQGLTIGALGWVVAALLMVSGLVRCFAAIRGTTDERFAALLFGLTDLILGVLAVQWPDVTLLVVAVLFGIRTLVFGLASIWAALARAFGHRASTGSRPQTHARATFGRWSRSLAAIVALVLAIGVGIVGGTLRSDSPTVDAFYAAPSTVPNQPGALLKAEAFTQGIPESARAWRILYTTTRTDGVPAVASGIVMVAADAPAGPRPVVAWAHGTTGYATNCAPSALADPLVAGALPALDQIIANQWILVATDYIGLGTEGPHPYLIGQGEGRSVLDAVRAAHQLDQIEMADETVVWGHSQGGHAALWTGQLAESYAPDVNVIGVAALAPASDAITLTANLPTITGGSVFGSYVIEAYTETYPDVDFNQYITPTARTLVREMASRCLSEPGLLVSVLSALSIAKDRSIFAIDPTSGAFGERLRENTPTGPISAPLFIGQGLADPLIDPAMQQNYVDGLCAGGQALEYRTYAGRGHMEVVAPDSPLIGDLLAWTQARLEHEPASSTCAAAAE